MIAAPGSAYTRVSGEPREALARWRHTVGPGAALLIVDFELTPWWDNTPPLSLAAIYLRDEDGGLYCAVSDQPLQQSAAPVCAQFRRWCEEQRLLVVRPGEPLPLTVTPIAKPWGRELWYTGVEQRGVCCFGDDDTSVPIPWLQAVLPDDAAGAPGRPLVLLKVLDPSHEEVAGDLYFELHEEKREVYVVTHVDPRAWPDGTGYIRYGFCPEQIAAAGSEAAFRQAYRDRVAAYEKVRRRIDALADPDSVPASLREEECRLRAAMDAYTYRRPLRVGDVVTVPLRMPHSLQHGVRTIEFQTPVYERKILSFAQRVLTQDHWDTEDAVEVMRLQPPDITPFERLPAETGVCCERIVDFEDFEVRRIKVDPGASCRLYCEGSYSLVMGVEGQFAVDEVQLGPEQAMLLPAGTAADIAAGSSAAPLVLLQALPRT
jgi:hypothetical protein